MQKTIMLMTILALASSCALKRAPSLRLLEQRADYDNVYKLQRALDDVNQPLLVPTRTAPVIADIWVHPHELGNGDYFRGAWVRTVVSRSHWQIEEEVQPLLIKEQKKKHFGAKRGHRND